MIQFHCLACGKLIQANDKAAGRSAKCPGCGVMLEIPRSSIAATIPPSLPVATSASTPVPPPPPQQRNPLPSAAPIAPPAPPPIVPSAAASESLSLDELFGSASAAPPIHGNGSAPPEMDFSDDYPRTGGRTGKKAAGKTGAKTASSAKPRKAATKAAAKDAEDPTRKIRNVGIAAIAAGVLGLALFAVPYAGPAVGAFGVVAGFYAILLASARRNSPMALALAGTAISVVAAGFGGYWTYSGMQKKTVAAKVQTTSPDANAESAARNADEPNLATNLSQFAGAAVKAAVSNAVADARNPLQFAAAAVRGAAADPAKKADRLASASGAGIAPAAGPVTLRLQDSTGAADKGPADASPAAASASGGDGASVTAAAVKAPIHWAAVDQNEVQGTDDVKVAVTKAVTGTLFFHDGSNSLLDGHETQVSYLHVGIKIQNNQPVGNIDYKNWMSLPDSAVTLTDDKGNAVARFDVSKAFPPGKHITLDAVHADGTIETSQSLEDTIIFVMPAASAEYLRLKLSGKAIGLPDDIYFQIPRSMIKPAETGNPLLPLGPP